MRHGDKFQEEAVFTICSWNYLAYALTLRESFEIHHDNIPFYIFIADKGEYLSDEFVITISEQIMPSLAYSSSVYSIMEFNTAVKPFCFLHLIEEMGFKSVIYFDPDILIRQNIQMIFNRLSSDCDAVLTPHILSPYDDDKFPTEESILNAGVYNLGFIGLNNSSQSRKYLNWWADKLVAKCVNAQREGYFVDQKFCDFLPAFIERAWISHDPGCNIAYWNLTQRQMAWDGHVLSVSGSPVKFIHFSGVVRGDLSVFSKYTNRIKNDDIGVMYGLFVDYHGLLAKNDVYSGGLYSKIPFGYGCLEDGTKISAEIALCIAKFSPHRAPKSLSDQTFEAAAEELPKDRDLHITRLAYQLHQSSDYLRSRFDLGSKQGRKRFIRWLHDSWAVENVPECCFFYRKHRHNSNLLRPMALWRRFENAVANLAIEPKESCLTIYGFFRSDTGLAQAARGYASSFQAVGGDVVTCSVDQHSDTILPVRVRGASKCALLVMNADNIMQLEKFIDHSALNGKKKIGFVAWELPVFPAAWAKTFDKIDEIWVPSAFVREALVTATSKPVTIVPHAVSLNSIEKKTARSELGLDPDNIIFLTTFDFDSFPARKNPLAAIDAFKAAFMYKSNGPRLIVKCHGTRNRQYLARMRSMIGDRPDIGIIDGAWSRDRIELLQASIDAFVSLHRSEGFGLNIAESMGAGKFVIVTDFSGNTDFTSADNSLLIPYKMQKVEKDEYPFAVGQWWADPNHDAAVEAFRDIYNGRYPSDIVDRARQTVIEKLSKDRVGRTMLSSVL